MLCSTARLLWDYGESPQLDLVWFIPCMASALNMYMGTLDPEVPEKPGTPIDKTWLASCCATLLAMAIIDGVIFTAPLTLLMLNFVIACLSLYVGGVESANGVLIVEACLIPVSPNAGIRIGLLVSVWVMVVWGNPVQNEITNKIIQRAGKYSCIGTSVRAIDSLDALVMALMRAIVDIIGSSTLYEVTALISVCVIAVNFSQTWYISHSTFPGFVRDIAGVGLSVVDIVRPFYEFTSAPEFQHAFLMALPELATVRALVYRVLTKVYPFLFKAYNGVPVVVGVGSSMLGVVSSIVLILISAAILVQVFPGGGAFVRSRWYWAAGFVVGLLNIGSVHLLSDPKATLLSIYIPDQLFNREYTQEGQYVLIAQLAWTFSCMAMFVIASFEDARRLELLKSRLEVASGTSGKFQPLTTLQAISNYLAQPSIILFIVTIFAAIIVAASVGSPISNFDAPVVPVLKPDWLVQTPLERATVTVLQFKRVAHMLNPYIRIRLLALALTEYTLEQVSKLGCLCVTEPKFVNAFTNAMTDAWDSFTSLFRRRLLEHKATTTSEGLYSVATTQRKLLGFTDDIIGFTYCQPADCSGVAICFVDVVKDGLDWLRNLAMEGLNIVSDLLTQQVLRKIPFVALLEKLFLVDVIEKLQDLIDFDIFTMTVPTFSVPLSLAGINLGLVPNFNLPSLPKVNPTIVGVVFAVIALLIAGCFRMGMMLPLLDSAVLSVELAIVSGAVFLLISIPSMWFYCQDLMQEYGRETVIEFNDGIYSYMLILVLLICSLLMRISEMSSEITMLFRSVGKKLAEKNSKPKQQPVNTSERRPLIRTQQLSKS